MPLPLEFLLGLLIVLTAISLAFSPASRQQELIDIPDEIDFISRRALSSTEAKVNSLLKNWDNPRLDLYKFHQDRVEQIRSRLWTTLGVDELCKAPLFFMFEKLNFRFSEGFFRL